MEYQSIKLFFVVDLNMNVAVFYNYFLIVMTSVVSSLVSNTFNIFKTNLSLLELRVILVFLTLWNPKKTNKLPYYALVLRGRE